MFAPNARIYVATKTVDFRGSFDRLAGTVRERLALDPRSGAFFVFFNRRADRVEITSSTKPGTALLYKRLDRGTFHGIVDLDPEQERMEIDGQKLRDLLADSRGQDRTTEIFIDRE